jgi:hypothetical protein
MLLVAGLVLLLLRQVMPIAARLAGGVALASFGTLSAVLARGAGVMQRGGARAAGGLMAGVAERLPALRASASASVQTLTPTVSAGRVAPVWRGVRGG